MMMHANKRISLRKIYAIVAGRVHCEGVIESSVLAQMRLMQGGESVWNKYD